MLKHRSVFPSKWPRASPGCDHPRSLGSNRKSCCRGVHEYFGIVTDKGGAMQKQIQQPESFLPQPPTAIATEWYALQTRPRHEKQVAFELEEKNVTVFLPMHTAVHQW